MKPPWKRATLKKPCHYCGKEVAHDWKSQGTQRGSFRHKCPHGEWCPGGSKLFRFTAAGIGPVRCKPCRSAINLRGRTS
jgi:hypothetical protein